MTLFIDASAFVAIIRKEQDREDLLTRMDAGGNLLTSGMALWEAARALGKGGSTDDSFAELHRYCEALRITTVPIGGPEAVEAVRAHSRYGKGTGHPAQLNMGDCFAYACAKTNGADLLYKGHDFSHTDFR